MQTPKRLLSSFDKFILGGLGCGLLILCVLAGWFIYIVNVFPVPGSSSTKTTSLDFSTATPFITGSDVPAITQSPTIIPTLGLPPSTLIPSPLPAFFEGTPPSGKIVFACYINQIDQICLMNADGTDRAQLTDFKATAFYPSLSPDGNTIYFSSNQSGRFEIYSMDTNGNHVQQLTDNVGSLYAPELSPAGDKIIFTNENNGLWIMKPDGKNPHPITDRDDIDPTWSPNGSMIAFASSRSGARQLFVMDADRTNIRQITDLDSMGGRSTWSPDGKRLAFYRGPAGDHNIYIINVDGTGLVQLTNGGDNLGPTWSPDGNWIAFTSFRDGNNEIYVIHPDGTSLTRLTDNSISDWQPRWGR